MAKELTKDERIIVRGYKEGLKNIRNDINLLYEKHAKDGKLSMADLSKYNRLTNLEKNIADNLKTAYDVQVKTTKKAVKGAFESAFYYSTFELEQEAKIPLMFGLLKKEAVNAVVEGPNRWPQIAKGHTKLTNAKIRDQIMQGVVQGKDAGQVTKAIAKEMNIAASKACRIVRTETHRAQNQGSLDSYTEAYKKGVLIQKVWVATLDDRTRDSHRVMDGQVVEVYEDFIMPGDIKASAPGLSGSASGDINCRCTIRAEVVGFTPQARRARGDGIIPQQTYQQWAKSKGIPFNKDMADEVKKLLEARGASKAVIQKASVENFSKFVNVDYQEDYKEELMPIYEKFAKKRGLTLAEYEKEATDKLEKLIKNADIQVNVKPETLLSIVNNGSFKTLSELGTASGRTEKYIANRVKIEKMIFDQNDGKIIYGTLQDKTLREIHTEGLTGYGDIKIILNKDKLGDVTTFTGCDSSFAFSTGVSSFKKPSIYFQSTLDVDKVQDILDSSVTHINHLGADKRFYIEAQVHKKVLLEEIEEVVFKDKQSLSKELAVALDKNKIKYRVVGEAMPVKKVEKALAKEVIEKTKKLSKTAKTGSQISISEYKKWVKGSPANSDIDFNLLKKDRRYLWDSDFGKSYMGGNVNEVLRGQMKEYPKFKEHYATLSKLCHEDSFQKDSVVYHYFDKLTAKTSYFDINKLDELIDTTFTSKQFISTTVQPHPFADRGYVFEIIAPKGAPAYPSPNFSEFEILLSDKTKFKIVEAYDTKDRYNPHLKGFKGKVIVLRMEAEDVVAEGVKNWKA